MIQPATWREIAHYVGKGWSGIATLVGVVIGAWIARSSERKHWLADNRKNECKELLSSMTRVADLALNAYSKKGTASFEEALNRAWEEERKCLVVLQDRIFIAEKLGEHKVQSLWQTVTTDYLKDGNATRFGDRLNEIKAIIIDIALNG